MLDFAQSKAPIKTFGKEVDGDVQKYPFGLEPLVGRGYFELVLWFRAVLWHYVGCKEVKKHRVVFLKPANLN